MEQKTNSERKWPFKIQFITLALIPLIIITVNIPDHIADQYPVMGMLYRIGTIAVVAVFLFAFPIGMIGFLNARDEKVPIKLNTATKMLGVTNCVIGALFVGIVSMILFFTFVMGI